jgi:hypothetical protein
LVQVYGDGKVGFIHVGKTGGTTVKGFLLDHGVGVTMYHIRGGPTLADIRKLSHWIVSVRDPVDRLMSCFDWHNPSGGGGVTMGKWTKSFYKASGGCFADFNEFATALVEPGKAKSPTCAAVANYTISPEGAGGVGGGSLHFAKGLRWYTSNDGVLKALLQSNLLVVHTESLESDLARVGPWLGIDLELNSVGHERHAQHARESLLRARAPIRAQAARAPAAPREHRRRRGR